MKKINVSKRNRIFPFSVLSALILFISLTLIFSCQKTYKFPFLNPELSFEQRANDPGMKVLLSESQLLSPKKTELSAQECYKCDGPGSNN